MLVGVSGIASLTISGCGGNEEAGFSDDAAADGTHRDSSTKDVVHDTTGNMDDVADDTSDAGGSPYDVVAVDTSHPPHDAGPDAAAEDADAAPEDADAGSTDADAMTLSLGTFAAQITTAYCQWLAACCVPFDAGAWDESSCESANLSSGFEGAGTGLTIPGVIDGGNLTFDPDAASDCLNRIYALPCPVVTATAYKQATASCYAAVIGTLDAGAAGCRDSVECQTTEYCNLDSGIDGATSGTCVALREAGAPCADDQTGEVCSYRGAAATCDILSNPNDAAAYSCIALRANGDQCRYNTECSSGLCNFEPDGSTACDTSYAMVYYNQCAFYAIQDAGGGG
jgi:hypothetical protein